SSRPSSGLSQQSRPPSPVFVAPRISTTGTPTNVLKRFLQPKEKAPALTNAGAAWRFLIVCVLCDLTAVLVLDGVNLGDSTAVAFLRQFSCQPGGYDPPHLIAADQFAAQGQHIGAVVFAAVACRRLVVAHRRPDTGHLVCRHARADSRSIND